MVKLAGIVSDSIVDGPGMRFTVFTQGCPHHCPGCHNPQTHDFEGGKVADTKDAATGLHAMNANSFTGAAYKLVAGADAAAFAADFQTELNNARWMCGFPEKLYIANVGNCLVVAYGNGELVNTFCGKLANATILYDEAIAG